MKKLFKSKAGFTLAELLIVIAIIAILVAIAVPIFTSSIQKAKDAVEDANVRAVKSAAMVEILDPDKNTPEAGAAGWKIEATINKGDISITGITAINTALTDADEKYLESGDTITIITSVNDTTVTY